MALVPPGNKQIGSFEIVGALSSGDSIGLPNMAAYATVKDSTVTTVPAAPRNLGIGSFEIVGAISADNQIGIANMASYAVVQYLPPYTISVPNMAIYATVKDQNTVAAPTAPRNLGIGSFEIVGAVSSGDSIGLTNMAVYAAVQYYKPRFETLIHSLYYGTNNPFLGTELDPYA